MFSLSVPGSHTVVGSSERLPSGWLASIGRTMFGSTLKTSGLLRWSFSMPRQQRPAKSSVGSLVSYSENSSR